MNVQRQYSLPNCTLVLEGLSDATVTPNAPDNRPLLSILVNADCQFAGIPQKLQGGRTFLENLVQSVSAYAQEYLSGVSHPQPPSGDDTIHLENPEGSQFHHLTWQPPADMGQQSITLELTTVQLFDLVEAIDQFFADSRTLPDLTLKLQPLSRRYRLSDEPLAQRVVPAALGTLSVAVAALVFFLLPPPAVREPEPKPQQSPAQTAPTPQNSPLSTPNSSPTTP